MREIIGNILSPASVGDTVIVCHQVNCMGVMGAGLAKQVKEMFPEVYMDYRKLCQMWRNNPSENLGYAQFCETKSEAGYIIANIFGQLSYGTGKRQTDYAALRDGLKKVAKAFPKSTVRIPYKMGCGLGGGDWCVVLGIIHDTLVSKKGIDVEIWKLH